jgi:hypothetical protein
MCGFSGAVWTDPMNALTEQSVHTMMSAGNGSPCDRTGKFVLIADRRAKNSGGNRHRLPLHFGGDQRPVGRIEFASFAMPEMPGHRTLVLMPPRSGDVADFHIDTRPAAQFVAGARF